MDFIKSRKFVILLLAVMALITSGILFHIYIQANYNPYSLASFCTINEIIDCDGVEKSMLAQVFGIPFACWGILIYSSVIFFLFVDKLKNIKFLGFLEVFKNPRMYIAAIGYIVFILSIILAITAYVQIKKICLMCALTYVFDLAIALVATDFKNGGIDNVFKVSFEDFIAAVKVPKYAVSFAACVCAVAGFLYYSNSTFVFVPHLQANKEIDYYKSLIEKNPYKFNGNVIGDKDAPKTIILFTDFECPICRINNVIVDRVAQETKGVKVEHRNYPLDNKCNKYLDQPFHEYACMYAKYSIAAENQNKMGEMNDFLFAEQPESEEQIIHFAEQSMFNIPKLVNDANSKETLKKIEDDIELGRKYEVGGTPAFIVNGKLNQGLKRYDDMKNLFKEALNEE